MQDFNRGSEPLLAASVSSMRNTHVGVMHIQRLRLLRKSVYCRRLCADQLDYDESTRVNPRVFDLAYYLSLPADRWFPNSPVAFKILCLRVMSVKGSAGPLDVRSELPSPSGSITTGSIATMSRPPFTDRAAGGRCGEEPRSGGWVCVVCILFPC